MNDLTLLAGTAIALTALCAGLNAHSKGANWTSALIRYFSYFGMISGLLASFWTLWLMTVEVW